MGNARIYQIANGIPITVKTYRVRRESKITLEKVLGGLFLLGIAVIIISQWFIYLNRSI